MKDAVAVTKLDEHHFFAVYDGHGGSSVSNACRDRLHQLLAQEVEPWIRGRDSTGGVDWEKALASCFTKMDNEVGAAAAEMEGCVNTVGSSAVVAIIGKEEIVVANSSNSRVVLCRDGVAIPLSRDHNPDRPDEKARVEAVMRSKQAHNLTTVSGDGDGELDGWILNLGSKPSRWMMEDMIFTAPSSSSSPCLKMQNFATREWKRKMERKWRDKEDEMDEGIGGKW